jgi:hypothetical protein
MWLRPGATQRPAHSPCLLDRRRLEVESGWEREVDAGYGDDGDVAWWERQRRVGEVRYAVLAHALGEPDHRELATLGRLRRRGVASRLQLVARRRCGLERGRLRVVLGAVAATVARIGEARHSVRTHAIRELDRQCVTASRPAARAVRGPASGGRQRAANRHGCDDEVPHGRRTYRPTCNTAVTAVSEAKSRTPLRSASGSYSARPPSLLIAQIPGGAGLLPPHERSPLGADRRAGRTTRPTKQTDPLPQRGFSARVAALARPTEESRHPVR